MHFIHSDSKNHIGISIWLLILSIMAFLMIVIGGLTRLTGSGLSMVDWNPIMGTIPPLSHLAWVDAFDNYKATPEFQIVNRLMSLDEFKYIFWWEWFHRFFARFIGIVFILPFLYFWLKNNISKKLFLTLTIVFMFGLFQALVGWWMVKSGLIDNPYVSAYRLTFHLSNALIIFCILFWTTLTSFFGKKTTKDVNTTFNNFFHLGLFFLFITIISGGFMAGTHSGQSFNTFPLMNGEFIPEGYYFKEYGWVNSFENTVAINFNHRWLASFTFLLICSFHLYLLISTKYKGDNFSLILVIITISLQFFLGILTLINNVPIFFASLHQTNSVLLLASMLFAYHRHKYKKQYNG